MGTNKPVVIGIAGGSGSGKTSVTKAIFDHFKGHSILILEQDYYYKRSKPFTNGRAFKNKL